MGLHEMSTPEETVCMKYQILFFVKNRVNLHKMSKPIFCEKNRKKQYQPVTSVVKINIFFFLIKASQLLNDRKSSNTHTG